MTAVQRRSGYELTDYPGCRPPDVTDLLFRSIQNATLLPQDALYRADRGPTIWTQLCGNMDATLGAVYGMFHTIQGPRSALIELIHERWPNDPPNVMVVGCGDGRRERHLIQSRLDRYPGKVLQLGYTDIEFALLREARTQFELLYPRPMGWFEAVVDFENVSELRSFRQRLDENTLVLLWGNTLGNVNERLLVQKIGLALKPGDGLMIEVLAREETEQAQVGDVHADRSDARVPFVLNPLRLIGINPSSDCIRIRSELDSDTGTFTRTYRYVFSQADRRASSPHAPVAGDVALLQIKAMTAKYVQDVLQSEGFENVGIHCHTYHVNNQPVQLTYAVGTRAPAQAASPIVRGNVIRNWRDVSIGIRVDGTNTSFWAIPERVDDGGEVRLDAVAVGSAPLGHHIPIRPGERQLRALLEAIAKSEDGQTLAGTALGNFITAAFPADYSRIMSTSGAQLDGGRLSGGAQTAMVALVNRIFGSALPNLARRLRERLRDAKLTAAETLIFRKDGASIYALCRIRVLTHAGGRYYFHAAPTVQPAQP